jgi:nucleotide-binding universal stress UspA family protein
MYEHILIALAVDPGDSALLDHAAALCRSCAGTLVLLHVAHGYTRDEAAFLENRARAYLEEEAAKLRGTGLEVETLLLSGEPASAIVQATAKARADLVVMGTHGHSQVRQLLLGSVTEEVVRHSKVPVLLVRPQS